MEYFIAFWKSLLAPNIIRWNSACVAHDWGFPAKIGKAEIDGAMSRKPRENWNAKRPQRNLVYPNEKAEIGEKFVEEVQI